MTPGQAAAANQALPSGFMYVPVAEEKEGGGEGEQQQQQQQP